MRYTVTSNRIIIIIYILLNIRRNKRTFAGATAGPTEVFYFIDFWRPLICIQLRLNLSSSLQAETPFWLRQLYKLPQ